MDWVSTNPGGHVLAYMGLAGLAGFVIFPFVGVGIALGGIGGLLFAGLFGLLLVFVELYILLSVISTMIQNQIEEYHYRSQELPTFETVEESDLSELNTVDDTFARLLFDNGYTSIGRVSVVDPEEMAIRLGIPTLTARDIVEEAREASKESGTRE